MENVKRCSFLIVLMEDVRIGSYNPSIAINFPLVYVHVTIQQESIQSA